MTKLCKKDFLDILSNYRLGDFRRAQAFTTGAVQVNVRLTTSMGHFALKHYQNRSRERVLFEADLLRYLHRHAFLAPVPIGDRGGGFVGEHKGKPYTICTIVPGRNRENPNAAQLGQLAECVATLHKVSRGYRPSHSQSRHADTRQFLWEAAQVEARKLGDSPNAKAKLRWMRDELDALKLPNSLPKGIGHYDYHYSNIMFVNGRLSGLVDFDDARYTRLVLDVANMGDYWASLPGGELDFDRMRKLLREYAKNRPLNEAEKRHLFDAWKAQVLLDTVYYFHRGRADDFREKRKIGYLNNVGREEFQSRLFA